MAQLIKIKKGLDIPLKGTACGDECSLPADGLYAICPDDYPGMTWKAAVKQDDSINCGDPLFYSKEYPDLKLVSPVDGKVSKIDRGERRHINYISVESNKDHHKAKLELSFDTESEIKEALCKTGLWALMRQRPFDIVPSPEITPRDIFVTAFDSAPLAGELIDKNNLSYINDGINLLKQLTPGQIYIGLRPGQNLTVDKAIITEFDGPHPAGNVGTQIAAIKPVNKGETVWTLDISTVARIGRLVKTRELDFHTTVYLTGPELKNPHPVNTIFGIEIKNLLKDQLSKETGIRIISGNVLTGIKVSLEGFLHYPYRQITVIEEGDQRDEFMGWASLSPKKYSVKRSFPAFLRGLGKPFDFDARIKGGKRAMILSGEYDKVFPFDIYPEYLIKAIMAGDIDRMEKLGIYEVAPEDFALPEFVDTSKIELQKIVREGLDNLRKELS